MNIEECIEQLKDLRLHCLSIGYEFDKDAEAIEYILTAFEKEKEKNKKAIDFINERKKTVNKDMAEGTRLQVGTFMWQVDELLEILKEE